MRFIFFHKKRDLKILQKAGITLFLIASVIIIKNQILGQNLNAPPASSEADDYEDCNTVGLALRGELSTYSVPADQNTELMDVSYGTASEDIVYGITTAEKDENIKAILLEVDSFGGGPVAGEEIANALKRSSKPTVALIRESGTSAAYWAASGADIIFASALSDVGSIGVTFSYLDNVKKNEGEGLTYQELTSGKFKDTGSPDKPLTEEEKTLLQSYIRIIHENFINAVSENRKLPIEKVRAMADGSSMLGEVALLSGLIDRIGDQDSAEEYLKEKIGEEVEICWN